MTTSRIQLGPFALDEIIGRGGMGEIWKGVHSPRGVPVAVKVLSRQGARRHDYLRRFRTEIRSVAGLDHPGIVLVFDHGEIGEKAAASSGDLLVAGSPYLVMEYARHGALDAYISRMNWPIARHVLFNTLDALAHAHARGVVHRDLKPQNILLGCARRDGLGLKLADFGLAHPLDLTGRTAKVEQGWGTPRYMAPEQFRGQFRDYGPHTDLYALGVVAWELTTGSPPFDGPNALALSNEHICADLPDFEPRFWVPTSLVGWLHRLLQKDFRDRFETAADAAFALAKVIEGDRGKRRGRSPERAETAPLLADGGTTSPLGGDDPGPNADTVRQQGATTELLAVADGRPDPVAHNVTLDIGQWVEQPSPRNHESAATGPQSLPEPEPAPLPDTWRQPELGEPSPQLLGAGLGLFGLRTLRLVDRDKERDRLWEALGEVHRHHHERLVLLQGRAGAGKSRLAQWICERATEVGAAVVMSAFHSPVNGRGDGLSGMVARHFGCVGLERADVERRLERRLRASGVTEPYEWQALTEFVAPSDAPKTRNDSRVQFSSDRQRHALLGRMVERIARRRPVILWLDDVQWGADALALAEHVLDTRRSTRSPILMVLTARTEALDQRPEERATIKRLLCTNPAEVLRVDRLAEEDTAQLVRRLLMLEGDLAAQVEARSAGNPLFAVQLVDDWVSEGKLKVGRTGFCLREDATASIPDDIHSLWRERIRQLGAARGEPARVALELGAALGKEVQRDEWLLGCELAGANGRDGLEEALYGRGLARPFDAGWRFVHGMLRESLERLSREAGRWERLNSVCADVLERRYGAERAQQKRRAHYLVTSGRLSDAAEPLLAAAGLHAERSHFSQAHQLLDQRGDLLSELDLGPADPQWGEGWVLRSEVFELEANYTEALTWAEMAVEHARRHRWHELLSPALRAAGGAHLNQGGFDRAHGCFDEAKDFAQHRSNGFELGLSLLGLGRVAQARADFEASEGVLEDAAALLDEHGTDRGLARCYNALGDLARQTRRLPRARRYAEMARRLFEAAGNRAGVADCLNDLSELNFLLGDVNRAEELGAQALHLYESVGSQQSMRVRLNLAFILLHRGEFGRARSTLARARGRFEREGQLAELAHCDVLLLACAAADEDWVIWDELISEAERLCEQTGLRTPRLIQATDIASEIAEGRDRPERAQRARRLGEACSAERD